MKGHTYEMIILFNVCSSNLPFNIDIFFVTRIDKDIIFMQAGKILMTYKEPAARVKRFIIWGVILVRKTWGMLLGPSNTTQR